MTFIEPPEVEGRDCPACGRPRWGWVQRTGKHRCAHPTDAVRRLVWQCECGRRWKYSALRYVWRRTVPTALGRRGPAHEVRPPSS